MKGALLLRLAASFLSMAAFIILVKNEQKLVTVSGLGEVVQRVKYSYSSGLAYLVWSNVLVTIYCLLVAISCIPNLLSGSSSKSSRAGKAGAWAIWILDQSTTYVLLAAAAAATEVAYLAQEGNEKTTWEALCPRFGRFCVLLRVSLGLTFASAVAMAAVSVASARHLFRHYYVRPSSAGVTKTVLQS